MGMLNRGRRLRREASYHVPRGNYCRRRWRKLILWAFAGSMVVLINIFLLRGALTKLNQIHHPKQQVSLPPRTEPKTESSPPPPSEPIVTFGTMGTVHDVRKYGAGESGFSETTGDKRSARLLVPGALVTPPSWDSTLCMEHWGRPELLTEADPKGYVVFVNGAEQLGGNKYLLADGMFIAKMLDRTLVEFPVKDARISVANSTMGLGAYWDLLAMCMTHRILDIRAFRRLVETGSLTADDFVTIETHQQAVTTHHFRHRDYVLQYFQDKLHYKVIVMDGTWKSAILRRNLMYLSPNPFFLGVSRMLTIGKDDFHNGEFIAVQWRTETATGDISACYDEVRAVIEENRIALGYTRNQVLFSTDMYGSTSGTYHSSKKRKVGEEAIRRIREDYPKALDNRLHDFFNEIKDSGVKAIVSGLVVAQARVLLASSLNKPELKGTPEACVCQKPFSGYIHLIMEWRTGLMRKDPESVIRLFPFEGFEQEKAFATTTDSNSPNLTHLAAGGGEIRLCDGEERSVVAEAESNDTVSRNDDCARRPLVDNVAQRVEGGLPGASRQAGSKKKGGTRWVTAEVQHSSHRREGRKIRKKRLGKGGVGMRGD